MAQDSWPSPTHNDRAVTDSEYERVAARFSDDGAWGDPTDTAIVSAGTGLQVVVRSDAWANVRGHAWTSGTSDVTLTIAENASGSARTDWVALRLDRSTWDVAAVVKQGTPGSGAPSLTREAGDTGVWEIPLALVDITSGASTVTVRPYTQYIGSRIRPCTSTTRPGPRLGEVDFETNTGRWVGWNGSAWKTLCEDSGEIVLTGSAAPWTVQTDSVLHVRSGVAHLRLGSFTRTSGGTLDGSDDSRLPINVPTAYVHPDRDQYAMVYVTGVRIGRVTIHPANGSQAGQVWLTQHPDISVGQTVSGSNISWVVS
ncbi:hypothetical protein [Streptomyces odontomachi]|uniref:hypothetical protein n=1 Tax=Streptomyces odontomachi TaxID=2944940 RepID=UPI00210E9B49|nr:hypothetical protein [Streptomyces sp. ODS25]